MGRFEQLSLFRQVMRLHQRKLPPTARAIGDRYVRQEFRTPALKEHQEVEFFRQWAEYVSHLEIEADLYGLGRDMADDTITSMSDEQRAQLEKLSEKLR